MAGNSRPKIVLDIMANAGKAKAEIDKLHGAIQGKFSKIAGIAKGVGLAMAGAGVGAVALAKGAVSSAADLEQSIGAVDAVFKGNAKQMHTWAKGAATSVGLTRNEFNELGTLIGTQLKNGGTAMEQLAPKTNSLIKLGADLSSMFGGSTREAVEALSSALKGERDPIERYGVSLTQAKIDAEAAALGFKKVGGSLSTEANQAATLSLIMKQTADAHGNFSRETDTLAHKQQVLQAKIENIKGTLGTALLPVVTKVADIILTKAVPSIEQWASTAGQQLGPVITQVGTFIATVLVPSIMQLLPILGSLLIAVSPILQLLSKILLPVLNQIATALADQPVLLAAIAGPITVIAVGFAAYTKAMKVAAIATKAYAAVQGILNAVMSANPIMLIVIAIAALVAAFIYAWNNCKTFRDTLIGAWNAIKTATITIWNAIKAFFEMIWNAIKAIFVGYLKFYVTYWKTVWTVIQTVFTAIWNAIKAFFEMIWNAIKAIFIGYLTFVVNYWKTVWTIIQTVFTVTWNAIKAFATIAWDLFKNGFSVFLNFLNSLWKKTWNAIKALFTAVWNAIKSFAISVWNAIKAFFMNWMKATQAFWEKTWNAIKNFFITSWNTMKQVFTGVMNTMRNLVKTTMSKIVAFFKKAWNTAKKIVTDAWNAVVKSIRTGINNAVKWVSGLGRRVRSAIGNLSNLLFGPGKALIDGFLRGIAKGWEAVKKKVSGFAGWIAAHKGPIEYDRVLLEPAGKAIMDGLMNGIESKRGKLKTQLRSLSNDIATNTFTAPGFELGALTKADNHSKANARPEIHIHLNTLNPSAETGRVIVEAISEHYAVNGSGRNL